MITFEAALNVVAGNLIGTNASGTSSVPNGEAGIEIANGANANRIGTDGNGLADAAERNVISGNSGEGIILFRDVAATPTANNVIAGNYIGTNQNGTGPLGNGLAGVAVVGGASSNVIGTNGDGVGDTAEGNVISGNGQQGISIVDAPTSDNIVAGNYIGTDSTGRQAIGNGGEGVGIAAAHNNVVGTNGDGNGDVAERNLISGNSADGVILSFEATGNVVAGNYIGTNASGMAALPNGLSGPSHRGGIELSNGATHNRIGTDGNGASDALERNVISGNSGNGITIFDDVVTGTNQNAIAGNFIGANATGTGDLGNGGVGIGIASSGNEVGGPFQKANTVAFNGGAGIAVDAGIENRITHNSFFRNAGLGIDLFGTGSTPNDFNDADEGPNRLQNTPEFSGPVQLKGELLEINYFVPSHPTYADYPLRVEFYAVDADGEEGETFLAADTYSASDFSAGGKTFSTAYLGGNSLVATATDDAGNTSEFSSAAAITSNEPPRITSSPTQTVLENTTLVATVTATDPNNDAVTFFITGGVDRDAFSVDSESGRLVFNIAPDFENPHDLVTGCDVDPCPGDNQYLIDVTANDGNGDTATQTITVTVVDVDDNLPQVTNNGLTLAEGATATISTARLNATDTDSNDAELVFTVTSLPTRGTLRRSGNNLTVNGTFTPGDLAAGRISYAHNGSNTTSDSFNFRVADPAGNTTGIQTFSITVTAVDDNPPQVTNNGLTLAEGATATISTARLNATDTDSNDTGLVFTITSVPSRGALRRSGTNLTVNGTFTQGDLAAGRISYAHNGSNTTSDSFNFRVADPAGNTTGIQTFNITVTPVDDPPTISGLADVSTNEGEATGPMAFIVQDEETSADALVVTATSSNSGLVPHENLALGGSGSNRTINVTPQPFQSGSTTVTLTVIDSGGLTAMTTFEVTVSSVCDATKVGDSNRDGKFSFEDVLEILAAGKFETGQAATGEQGDWNGDGVFDGADIQLALDEGTYEKGVTSLAPGCSVKGFLTAVAVQEDERIVVAGMGGNGPGRSIILARFDADGRVDRSFAGGTGAVTIESLTTNSGQTTFDHSISDIAITSDGTIVVTGSSTAASELGAGTLQNYFTVASFSSDGLLISANLDGNEQANDALAATIQDDDKVVVAGVIGSDFGVARFETSGRPDPDFGVNGSGRALSEVGDANITDYATAVAIQPDGKIVAVGVADGGTHIVLSRYEHDGRPDASFGDGGVATRPLDGILHDIGTDVAVQADGRILVSVTTVEFFSPNIQLMRFAGDGDPDTGFGTDGVIGIDLGGGQLPLPQRLAPQSDGKVLVLGSAGENLIAARFHTDGTPDLDFGRQGLLHVETPGIWVADWAVLSPNEVVVAGNTVRIPPAKSNLP